VLTFSVSETTNSIPMMVNGVWRLSMEMSCRK
jgi:hypothetical protein